MAESSDINYLLADIASDYARLRGMLARFDSSYEVFRSDYVYQDACVLSLMRATTAVSQLPDGFKRSFPQIDWEKLESIRKYLAQNQRALDAEVLWDAVTDYALPLGAFCEERCGDGYC